MLVLHSAYTDKLTLFLGSTDSTFRKYHHHYTQVLFLGTGKNLWIQTRQLCHQFKAKAGIFSLCSSPVLPNLLIFLPSQQEDKEQEYHFIHCETTWVQRSNDDWKRKLTTTQKFCITYLPWTKAYFLWKWQSSFQIMHWGFAEAVIWVKMSWHHNYKC